MLQPSCAGGVGSLGMAARWLMLLWQLLMTQGTAITLVPTGGHVNAVQMQGEAVVAVGVRLW